MKEKRFRDVPIFFRVTQEEYDLIMKNYSQTNYKTLSQFLRKMAIEGRNFEVNLSPFFDISREINAVGNNINQIAKALNMYGASGDEGEETKRELKKIWQLLNTIQLSLQEILEKQ